MAVALHSSVDTPGAGQLLDAGLYFPVSDLTIAGITGTPGYFIPVHITSYTGVSKAPKLGVQNVIPITMPDNTSYGGSFVSEGGQELAKLSIDGYIDTPTTNISGAQLSSVTVDGLRTTYAELIAMYIEGRAQSPRDANTGTILWGWKRLDPLWFRDPFNRVYSDPRIIDFTAGYVEAVPGRTIFTMKLVV